MRDRRISEWRRQMESAGIDDAGTLDELEGHVQEEMERLMEGGASEEEALRAAVEKLGKPEAIREEFAKGSDPKEERLKRILRRVVAWMGTATVLVWILSVVTSRSYDVSISPSQDMCEWAGYGEFYSPTAGQYYTPPSYYRFHAPSAIRPIVLIAERVPKYLWYGICLPCSHAVPGLAIPTNFLPSYEMAVCHYPILSVKSANRFFCCFIGYDKRSIGLLVGKPYILWRDHPGKATVSPRIMDKRTLRLVKLCSALWCVLVTIPLLPSMVNSRWIGRGLYSVMGMLMVGMLGWELHTKLHLIPLFLVPQIIAYLAQGCWLCLHMRRRITPYLATAEVA